ncbi:hypothetical protein GQX74_015490 [Glossina fuscipes]|nr:hypothetical protein GQX74_015490 [Glossina fuscipes]
MKSFSLKFHIQILFKQQGTSVTNSRNRIKNRKNSISLPVEKYAELTCEIPEKMIILEYCTVPNLTSFPMVDHYELATHILLLKYSKNASVTLNGSQAPNHDYLHHHHHHRHDHRQLRSRSPCKEGQQSNNKRIANENAKEHIYDLKTAFIKSTATKRSNKNKK